jgi:ferredoxin
MITIDNGKCNGCGLCARICHEHCIVVDDSLLEAMDTAVFRFSHMLYYWIYKNPITGSLAKLAGPAMRNEFIKAKPKLEHTLKKGRTHKFHPPVVIFIVGDKKVPLSLESAQYALYNILRLYLLKNYVLPFDISVIKYGKSALTRNFK